MKTLDEEWEDFTDDSIPADIRAAVAAVCPDADWGFWADTIQAIGADAVREIVNDEEALLSFDA